MLEQMVEARSWKATQRLIEDGRYWLYHRHNETVEQLIGGCTLLSNTEYLVRNNRALMILAVIWAKEHSWLELKWCGTQNDGSEEWFWRTIRLNLSGIFNSIYKKLRQQEDLTWQLKQNTRSRFGFVIRHVPCNKMLIRSGEISLREIDNLLLRWEKEDQDTLLLLYS